MNKKSKKSSHSIKAKIVIIGDGGVGKTSIVRQYLGWGFKENYLPTMGANFYQKTSSYDLGFGVLKYEWSVWDLSGQPLFNDVRDNYYTGSAGGIVVFDITRKKTAKNTKNWVQDFDTAVKGESPLILVGNKVDLRGTKKEELSQKFGRKLAEKLSNEYGQKIPYLETSAKTGENLGKAFQLLGIKIAKKNTRS